MIITVTGPSGVGKGYLVSGLRQLHPQIQEATWMTTRPLRPGEEGRSNRCNVTPERFRELKNTGQIILVQKLFRHMYGLTVDEDGYRRGVWITELHTENLTRAATMTLPIYSIALVPDSIDFLKYRLHERSTETDDQIQDRLQAAEQEVQWILRNKDIFMQIFTVSRTSEATIVSNVSQTLKNTLKELR